MRVYVDASAATKLLSDEPGSGLVIEILNDSSTEPVATDLLETELRRAATRLGAAQATGSSILDGIELYAIERSDFRAAGTLPGLHLRSLDALHVQGALTLQAEAMLTFDARLAAAAVDVGIEVLPRF